MPSIMTMTISHASGQALQPAQQGAAARSGSHAAQDPSQLAQISQQAAQKQSEELRESDKHRSPSQIKRTESPFSPHDKRDEDEEETNLEELEHQPPSDTGQRVNTVA